MSPLRALLVLALLVLPGALATHDPSGRCDSRGRQPALGIVEVTGGSADTTVYVDDRGYITGSGIWLYLETNGIWSAKSMPGIWADGVADHDLQRGGSSTMVDETELCRDDPNVMPDLWIG